jgi:hypothetical protein
MVEDGRPTTKLEPSITKVQPVPKRTVDTETVRVERGTANIRKARNAPAVRAFVKDVIVPLLSGKPDKTSNLQVLLQELNLQRT